MTDSHGTGRQPPSLTSIEFQVLDACREAVQHQQGMLPLLAQTLGVAEEELFYTWAFRRCRQRWKIAGTDWNCYFHGLECDLDNSRDGRNLRLDFGPGGHVDTFTAWGIHQFIVNSVAPWPEYSELKHQLGDDTRIMFRLWDRLESYGVFEPADRALIALQQRYTTKGADGITTICFPESISEKTQIDCSVAHRPKLSAIGLQLLESHTIQAVT